MNARRVWISPPKLVKDAQKRRTNIDQASLQQYFARWSNLKDPGPLTTEPAQLGSERNLCVLPPFIGICIQPTFVFPKQLAPLETKTNMSLMIRSFGERNSRLYKYENTLRGDVIVG